jgi:ornithine cyclodeaminase/alanine dehydrogenase
MIILSDNDISNILTMEDTIKTVEKAFKEYAKGSVIMPPRSTIMIPDYNGSISFMPSYLKESESQAMKIISIYPDNPELNLPTTNAWIIVNDPKTGMIMAFMDASHLTAMRTGAISGVASKYLAPDGSDIAALYGAGIQGKTQVWAIASVVGTLDKVKVYDPNPKASEEFSKEMSEKLKIKIVPVETGKEAAKDADIIITATTSKNPVLKREWLKEKVHINAIGAFYPDQRELDTRTIAEAKVVVDDLEAIMKEAGDILIPLKEGAIAKDHVYAELKDLVTGEKEGRDEEDGLTVFKSVGIAIQDSSVANLVLDKLEI